MLVELSVVEQRYHAVLEVLHARVPVVEVAARYGVSRKSVHAWVRRYEQSGLAGLADRSHRPHGQPRQVPAEVEAAICQLRTAHPKWGPRRLVVRAGPCRTASGAVAVDGVPGAGAQPSGHREVA
jgi:transposase-like protein